MSKQLGLLLVREKVITRAQLDEANSAAVNSGKNLVVQLLDQHTVDDGVLSVFISEKLKIPLADRPLLAKVKPQALRSLARDLVDEFSALPIDAPDSRTLQLAMVDPTDHMAIDELGFFTGKTIKPMVASRRLIHTAIKQYYNLDKGHTLPEGLSGPGSDMPASAPATRLPERSAALDSLAFLGSRLAAQKAVESTAKKPSPNPKEVALAFDPGSLSSAITSPSSPVASSSRGYSASTIRGASLSPEPSSTDTSYATQFVPRAAEKRLPLDLLHKNTLSRLDEVSDKDAVADCLLGFASEILKRVALFTIKKNVLLGWEGRGDDFTHRNLKGIMIPLNSPSIFQKVKDTKVYYMGEVPRSTVNQIFLTALGNIYPPNVLLIPILVRDKVVCIFYGDQETEPIPMADLHYLHLLTPKVETAFEKLILSAKKNKA